MEHESFTPTTIWNRVFLSIFFTNLAMNFGQSTSNTLLSKYADFLGAPATMVGLLMSMFTITAILFKIVSAPAMDTYNKRNLVMLATCVLAVSFFGYGASRTMSWLMVFRLVQGAGQAFANVCCLAMVSEAIPKEKYATGIGYFSLAQVIAQALGPTVGLWLLGLYGYSTTFIISGAIMVAAFLSTMLIRIPFTRTKKLHISLSNVIAKEALIPSAVMMFLYVGFAVINSFLVVYAGKLQVQGNIGLFFTVYALTMLLTRPVLGKLTDRFGLVRVSVPAICLTIVSFFLISAARTLPMFLLAAFLNACGFGACTPSIQSLSMKCVRPERRGAGSSTNFIGMDVGTLIGPVIAGWLAEAIHYPAMWRLITVSQMLAVAILIIFRKKIGMVEEDFRAASIC
jgi:MFS family permease